MSGDHKLSSTMLGALSSMPVTLALGPDGYKWLPKFGPSGATIKALHSRGLIACDGERWSRTALGESVWAHR